jgi:phosphatidylserine/phosphatidylglycerophosphate/cardiolipin synthase-like enzyme
MANPTYLTPAVKPTTIKVEAASVAQGKEVFPPTRATVTPLIDGEAAFREMYRHLKAARRSIDISIWYIQLGTFLKGPSGSRPAKVKVTDLLKQRARAGVKVRILVSYLECVKLLFGRKRVRFGFCQALNARRICARLRRLHRNIDARPAYHPYKISHKGVTARPGCSHEKTVLVDGKRVFCGGLEFAKLYTNANPKHRKSNRHDVHALLEGPVVTHFAQHFEQRWKRVLGSKYRAPKAQPAPVAAKQQHAVQVGITRSQPGWMYKFQSVNRGVWELYSRAIAKAEKLIYIENQYFRDKDLTAKLVAQLRAKPKLQIIVLIPEKSEEVPSAFTRHADYLQRRQVEALRAAAKTRVGVFSARRKAGKGQDIYVHSKVMIIDDQWITIGSANTNPRSFYLDDEINFCVRDNTLATTVRRALWGEQLGVTPAAVKRLDQNRKVTAVAYWHKAARVNDRRIKARRTPKGFVVTHRPPRGKKLDPKAFGINPLYLRVLPSLDKFVGDFPVGPTRVA